MAADARARSTPTPKRTDTEAHRRGHRGSPVPQSTPYTPTAPTGDRHRRPGRPPRRRHRIRVVLGWAVHLVGHHHLAGTGPGDLRSQGLHRGRPGLDRSRCRALAAGRTPVTRIGGGQRDRSVRSRRHHPLGYLAGHRLHDQPRRRSRRHGDGSGHAGARCRRRGPRAHHLRGRRRFARHRGHRAVPAHAGHPARDGRHGDGGGPAPPAPLGPCHRHHSGPGRGTHGYHRLRRRWLRRHHLSAGCPVHDRRHPLRHGGHPARCRPLPRRGGRRRVDLRFRGPDGIGRVRHHRHRRHPGGRSGDPQGQRRRPPSPGALRCRCLPHRRHHLRGRGQVPAGPTLTQITAFVPSSHKVLNAGLLPQADAFAGYATVGSSGSAVGYMVGGEVTGQSGNDQAGVASGSLRTVISLRRSRYGGPAGSPGAGAPFAGTLLIADRGNDRLLALDRARNITWQYPSATMPPPPGGFYFPDDAFFIKGGTGIISNQEDNHTIVEIGYPSGKILWQYGHPGQSGSAPGYLNQPDDAYLLKSGTITVADASNNRILFISPQGQVTGQIGNGADAHNPPTSIAYPNGDTPLANGDVLVSEINGSWIDEYTPTGTLVWTVHIPTVNYPSDPQQLASDLYLMTDYDPPAEGRILEFTRAGQVTWLYDATSGDAMLKKPSLAERLPNGLIMVNDDYRNRVVVIDPTTYSIVWQYGITDVSGTAPGLVSIPDGFDLLEANGSTPTHPQTG